MANIKGAKSYLLEHLEKMKNHQKQQIHQLQQKKDTQWAQLQEGQKRVDNLIESNSSDTDLKQVQTDCEPIITAILSQQSQRKKISENCTTQKAGTDDLADFPIANVKGVPNSFDELIEQQMQSVPFPQNFKDPDKKPAKRPFLKKGVGLQRYQSKPLVYEKTKKRTQDNKNHKNSPLGLTRNLKLKPNTGKSKAKDTNPNSVSFSFPEVPSSIPSKTKKIDQDSKINKVWSKPVPPTKKMIPSKSGSSCRTLTENEQLVEFEKLETAAHNTSLNSDSSIVHQVLSGEPLSEKRSKNEADVFLPKDLRSENNDDLSDSSSLSSMHQYVTELRSRKIMLEKKLLELRKEDNVESACDEEVQTMGADDIRIPSPEFFTHHEKFSTGNFPEGSNLTLSSNGSSSVFYDDIHHAVIGICGADEALMQGAVDSKRTNTEGNFRHLVENNTQNLRPDSNPSLLKLTEKLDDLEREIKIYKENNKKLVTMNSEKEKEIKDLKKDREEFEKFKETEKSKMEKEINEKRNQLKKEKQTFERYHKLSKDLPGKKEKEELTNLRKQVETLQEELKKLGIKSSSESTHLRKLLTAAEKERNRLKVENERLEKQYKELQITLQLQNKKQVQKHQMSKPAKYGIHSKLSKNIQPTKIDRNTNNTSVENAKKLSQTKLSTTTGDISTVTKSRVHFNLEPNIKNISLITPDDDTQEIKHGDKIERIFKNGEREILFPTGTRKWISSDGTHVKFHFYNGDKKEIFPDKREVYKFLEGTTGTIYPDGLEVFEYPNKQIERLYSDGMMQIIFSDGTEHFICTDGSQETRLVDGTVAKVFSDGTEAIEFPSGEKEIRASEYLRREYSDGTIKTVYKTGRQETRYVNGRLRIKDKDGNVVVDSR